MKKLRVGVIYGGRSSEHEVSLASAAAVMSHLDRARYDAVPLRIDREGRLTIADRPPTIASAAEVIEQARVEAARSLRTPREVHLVAHPGEETILSIERPAKRPSRDDAENGAVVTGLALDVIFPVLHGPYGEDGTIQGLLELANVPYVGCGVLASAVGMDKAVMKLVFKARGLPIVDHEVVLRRAWLADRAGVRDALVSRLGFPVFVKPANLGSSVGISKAKDPASLEQAMDVAAGFDRKIVVEAAVPEAREIECAVLGNDDPQVSVPGEIVPGREFYDYEAKYLDASSETRIPAPLTERQTHEVQRLAVEAFLAIDGAGLARVDFLLSGRDERIYVNEINTIPGFTTISMYAKMWETSGMPYASVLERLIALALERHTDKQQLRTSYI